MKILEDLYTRPAEKNYKKLLSLIKSPKKLKIIDVGCGPGKNTVKLKEVCPNSVIYGIDFNKEELKKCKELGIITKKVNLENEKFPFKNNFFDVVLSNMVIEHIDNLDTFISEQRRVLKKNGLLIISTNNASSWHNIFAIILGWMPFDLTNITVHLGLGNPLAQHKNKINSKMKGMCHKRLYTIRYLTDFLKVKKFHNIKSYRMGYLPFPSFLGQIDKIHSQFVIVKFIKNEK